MKKILLLEWDSFAYKFIKEAWGKCGYTVASHPFLWKEIDETKESEYIKNLIQIILDQKVQVVFTINYFPMIAITCKACRVKYVSWTYDSPFARLYSDTIFFETNYIFVFDSHTCQELQKLGATQVYYLPMAADCTYYDQVTASSTECKAFQSDIAFVGSMYTEKGNSLLTYLEKLDAYDRGYIEALMQAQKGIYGYYFLEEILDQEFMKRVLKVCPLSVKADGLETIQWKFAHYILDRKITALERMEILQRLQSIGQVKLYTPMPTPELTKVKNMGTVEYYQDAPKVFKHAKINLNITLKSILTGIPLRIFDIMGCGGFVLTNYQADLMQLFVPDEDFVYYENYEDLVHKVEYYLTHEKEREQIARSGYEKVKQYHSYINRVQTMLEVIDGE